MRIADALERQAQLMAGLALSILRADAQGRPLTPTPQDETCASYSIWRDRLDFDLDPRRDASEIVRRVYALGHPYQGALIAADGETLTVRDAVEVEDLNFALRDPGKVWRIDADGPVMICGRGLVKFTDLQDAKGRPWMPTRLRTRFAPTWNGEHNPLA